jgi:RHS repeat-associated protein
LAHFRLDEPRCPTPVRNFEGDGANRRIELLYYGDGLIDRRIVSRWDAGVWKQITWTKQTFKDNDLLESLEVRTPGQGGNGANGDLLESHTLEYWNDNDVYLNGNRVKDSYLRAAPPNTTRSCEPGATACHATYGYDARDRLFEATDGHGGTIGYELDLAGNVTGQTVDRSGTSDDVTITQTYDAQNRLKTRSEDWAAQADVTRKYKYNSLGDLWCVTNGSVADGWFDCANPGEHLDDRVQMYAFDALERLISSRTFNTSGTAVVRSTHEYDGLDRPIKARECHDLTECAGDSWWTSGREAKLRYLGSSSLVAREDVSGAARTSKLKMYSYDPGGGRSAVETTNLSNTVADYTYAYDAHGSVALLVTDERSVQASYGYDPYGGEDETLTKELKQGSTTIVTDPDDPLNAYRYTGKREDTGSGTLDMGARRFAPDTGRFISSDFYTDALTDIGLSTDPLAQNRYALASGNPIGYIEVDGHKIEAGGGGTSTGCLVQNGCYRSNDPDAFDTTPKPSGIEHFAHGVAGAIKSGVKDTLPLVNVTDPEQMKAAWKGVGTGLATLGKCAAHSQPDCRKIVDAAIKPCLHGAYGERAGCLTGTVLFATVGTKGTGVVSKAGRVGTIAAKGAGGGEDVTRVGRWMRQQDYEEMVRTGRVQPGKDGSARVIQPPNPRGYRDAPPGSVYAEFNVPSSALFPGGRDDWRIILGPDTVFGRHYGITELPRATCISLVCSK